MRMRSYMLLMAASIGLILNSSCKDCPAVPPSYSTLSVQMYYYDSLLLTGERVSYQDTFLSIRAEGLAAPLFESSSSGSWEFPLSNQSEELSLLWEEDGQSRTLAITYNRTPVPLSPDCGIYEVYENIEIASHSFDSVRLVKSMIEVNDNLHIEIFANP